MRSAPFNLLQTQNPLRSTLSWNTLPYREMKRCCGKQSVTYCPMPSNIAATREKSSSVCSSPRTTQPSKWKTTESAFRNQRSLDFSIGFTALMNLERGRKVELDLACLSQNALCTATGDRSWLSPYLEGAARFESRCRCRVKARGRLQYPDPKRNGSLIS